VDDAVSGQAITYLRWSLPGIPAMLVVLAWSACCAGCRTPVTLWLAVVGRC